MNTAIRRAKLFVTGGSQAVRLPAEFRFDGDEVFIRKDRVTGDVILSSRPRGDWEDFMRARAAPGVAPADFVADRDGSGGSDRDPFADWGE